MSIEENRERFYYLLIGFYDSFEYEKKQNPELPIGVFTNQYLDNEISMEKGMLEYFNYLRSINDYNKRLLTRIKKVMGKTFYKHLLYIIETSEGAKGEICFTKEPIGEYRTESGCGRTIKGIWVDQRSVGDSGDSWAGTVCVKLKENKFLKFYYEM